MIVEIFTDGACRGNPGPGGWGVLLRYNGVEKTLCGGVKETTNNRMEMTAAIEGLRALKKSCFVKITTDSEYLKNGVTQWLAGWIKNNWKTAAKKPVKNQDLWEALQTEIARHTEVTWHWVRGHSGHRENEIVDELANAGIDQLG